MIAIRLMFITLSTAVSILLKMFGRQARRWLRYSFGIMHVSQTLASIAFVRYYLIIPNFKKNWWEWEKYMWCTGSINKIKKKAGGKRMNVKVKNNLPLWICFSWVHEIFYIVAFISINGNLIKFRKNQDKYFLKE